MKHLITLLLLLSPLTIVGQDFRVANATICYDSQESKQVKRAVADLRTDITSVTGVSPKVAQGKASGRQIIVGTFGKSKIINRLVKQGLIKASDLKDKWESYVITVTKEKQPRLVVAGSDSRGTIYGIYDLSERIGVSPWYWWADVPVIRNEEATVHCDYFASGEPTVRYRGIFINDEDWGLKPWSENNYEKELGDIGPRTYARVCELLLRLKANMLAPAMHSCTGAFYSHALNKVVCDSFGIIITTSHCEPLLLNNAAKSEWDQQRDGDWNYKTNRETIWKKWDDRLAEASQYENIYTVAMRGVHDAGLRGNLPMNERVPLIEKVIKDQRELLVKHHAYSPFHTDGTAASIPQIFVPYKETMDIYENGLRVPDDITLVWVDDNYGYMKRVSNPEEQQRSGRAGVYYHLSYLGAPHDYLWLNTTPPVLMYEELKKAYDNGADRYWLLNVGDIKPMELGMHTFFELAWNVDGFSFEKVRQCQADFLASTFSHLSPQLPSLTSRFQTILDQYYRLAWSRKPEFMGWEYQWDDKAHTGLKDTEFSFQNYGEAQQRLADYQWISDDVERISEMVRMKSEQYAAAFFELLQFPVQAAYQMNRKFLMAQLNHELAAEGRFAEANWAARQTELAYDSINALNDRYNEQPLASPGKWRGIMALSTSFTQTAQYYQKPTVIFTEGVGETPVVLTPIHGKMDDCYVVNLAEYESKSDDARLVAGLGYDGQVVQLGSVTYLLPQIDSDTITVKLFTVPFWPLYSGKTNAVSVSVDGATQVFENRFKEYDRTWKDQVMRNGATCQLRFTINRTKSSHIITFHAPDFGQMLQRVMIDWGGLKKSYIGPQL